MHSVFKAHKVLFVRKEKHLTSEGQINIFQFVILFLSLHNTDGMTHY